MTSLLIADAMGGPFFIILPIMLLLAVGGAVLIVVLITRAILRYMKKKDRTDAELNGEKEEESHPL